MTTEAEKDGMLGRLIKRCYRSMPGFRELTQLRDYQIEMHYALKEVVEQLRTLNQDKLSRFRDIEAIRIQDFAIREHPRYADPRRLLPYEHPVCSQNGEDGVIREIFRRVGTTDRTFVEVGVGDGMENNTVFLLAQGWNGSWIDGNPSFLKALEKTRDLEDGRLKTLVSIVNRENAASLFQRLGVPTEFDLLSLDIDQNTYYIWEGLRAYRPRVVVVEYNASMPADLDWKVHYAPERMWDSTHNFGASLKAFENLGRELGYSLVGCEFTGLNAFFVRDDLVGDRFAAPFTSENHYEPPRYVYTNRRGHAIGILDRMASTEGPAAAANGKSAAGYPESPPMHGRREEATR